MDVKTLTKLTKWMETTDLEEITWRNGEDKISLKLNNNPEQSAAIASTSFCSSLGSLPRASPLTTALRPAK